MSSILPDLRELPGNIEVGGKVLASNGVDRVLIKTDTTSGNKYVPFIEGSGSLRTGRRSDHLYVDAQTNVLNCNANSSQTCTNASVATNAATCNSWIGHTTNCDNSTDADYAGQVTYATGSGSSLYCTNSNNVFGSRVQQHLHTQSKIYTGSNYQANGIYWETHGGGLHCTSTNEAGSNWKWLTYNDKGYYAENTCWIVEGTLFAKDYTDPEHDWWAINENNSGWVIGDAPQGGVSYGVEVVFDCSAYGWAAGSDRRIKRDIVELDDGESLTILRKLKPCKYNYVPSYNVNRNKQIGFIAQEVREVLPDSVSLDTKWIPNIACIAEVKYGIDENLVTFILTNELPAGVTVEKNTELSIGRPSTDREKVTVVNVISNTILEVKAGNEKYFESKPPQVFVYGTYVNDFHHLFKDKIWAVGVAALQELDRIHNNQKDLLSNIQTDYDQTMLYISDLKNTCSSIINRLDVL